MRTTTGRHPAADGHAAGAGHRLGWAAVTNVGFGIGLGLLLCAVYALRSPGTWAHGMLWGVGGYATFFLAPAAGLPPEIPGTVTEALGARQLWWLLAVTFTGVGLSLLFLGPGFPTLAVPSFQAARETCRAQKGIMRPSRPFRSRCLLLCNDAQEEG